MYATVREGGGLKDWLFCICFLFLLLCLFCIVPHREKGGQTSTEGLCFFFFFVVYTIDLETPHKVRHCRPTTRKNSSSEDKEPVHKRS